MNLGDMKFRIRAGAYNLVDYARHPILHLTDGKGLGITLQQRTNQQVGVKLRTKVVARDRFGRVTGVRYGDMSVIALAQLIQNNILDTAESVKDTGGTSRSLSVNSAATSPTMVAGTSTTAAAFADNALGAQSAGSSGSQAATINALSGSSFTATATITNSSGGNITYAEIGETVVVSTYTFLLSHTVFTGLLVSNGGALACTDTWSFS